MEYRIGRMPPACDIKNNTGVHLNTISKHNETILHVYSKLAARLTFGRKTQITTSTLLLCPEEVLAS
jgi:hypothetical protein